MSKIWYIETKEDDTATETTLDGDGQAAWQEPYRAHGYYAALTRNKAKAKFFKEYDLPFIEPLNLCCVVDCEECHNEGGEYRLVGVSIHDPGYPDWVECCVCKGKSIRYEVR